MRSKTRVKKLLFLLVLLVVFLASPARAQTKIQVVTKTISRKLQYQKNTQLRLTAEKAKVNLKGWDKNYIGVTLKLVAKHPERQIAEKELDHLQHYIKESGSIHDLGNYFLIPKGTSQIQANLKAEYEISVPENLPITISCKFGEVNLENTKGRHTIAVEYGQLNLNQIAGEMNLHLVLTDVKSRNTNLILKCKAEKADVVFENADGSYQVANSYGQVKLTAGKALRHVNIQASRTAITFIPHTFEAYNYDLATSYAELVLPPQAKPQIKLASGDKSTYRNLNGKNLPLIKIATTYSPITIRTNAN